MQKPVSSELARREPLVVRLGDDVYRRVGAVWVDRAFVMVSTALASRLDEFAHWQAVEEGEERPRPR